ncbi:MAG: aldehyde dehydrogenase family protein [Acidimicrobiales bacterium]
MAAKEFRMLIGGDLVAGEGGSYDIVNPATEAVVGQAPEASTAQVEAAAAAAAEAFGPWTRTKPEERAALLDKAADLMRDRVAELIPLVQAETGATLRVTETMQVPTCVDRLRRYARGAMEANVIPLPPGETATTALAAGGLMSAVAVRQPVGAVACITPYNFPIVNMAGKIGPALAMGNTVVVKPAPQDPLAITVFGEILRDAGFPPGVVNVVTGSGAEAGQALVASNHIDMVSFTGSTPVGRAIGEVAGRDMKRLLLELGGKGAGIVFDDADLKTAISTIVSAWAFHSGQICTAPTRVIAQRGVYDEVVGGLQLAAGYLKVGDPLEADTIVGPLVSALQRDRVEALIQAGVSQGGELVAGGRRPEMDNGFYVAPTLIAGCKPDNAAVQQEFFGPVVVVVPFDEDDEAVSIANSTEFGLYDYVFTADTARAMRVAKQLRTGNVGINTAQRNQEAPFGGFKMSGVGRDGGSFGLHAYSELQSIVWPG